MPEANFVIATIAVTINAVLAAQTLGSGSADETEPALVRAQGLRKSTAQVLRIVVLGSTLLRGIYIGSISSRLLNTNKKTRIFPPDSRRRR